MISAPSWLLLSAEPPHAVSPPMCARSRLPTPLVAPTPLALPHLVAPPQLELAPPQLELAPPVQLELAPPVQLELALPQLAQSLLRNPIPRMSHAIHHQLDSNRSRPVLAAILSSFTLLELAQGPLLLLLDIRCTPRGCPHVLRFTGPICV
uniref:Uncharacterized protein n=1 Tax=Cacopsylla melanoneura TaxID=428564 RepID=A0A8D8R1X7_9HEMI